jgi:hypothetical protein
MSKYSGLILLKTRQEDDVKEIHIDFHVLSVLTISIVVFRVMIPYNSLG